MTLSAVELRNRHSILSFVFYLCVLTFKCPCKIFTQVTIEVVKIIVYFIIPLIKAWTKSYMSEIKEHLSKCTPKPSSKESNTCSRQLPRGYPASDGVADIYPFASQYLLYFIKKHIIEVKINILRYNRTIIKIINNSRKVV